MRKVFIDLGAYDGDTMHEFCNWTIDAPEWELFAFEPNPRFIDRWKLLRDLNPKLTAITKAAWIKDGPVTFQQDLQDLAWGSTLLKEKQGPALRNEITVEGVDFSSWLFKHFDKKDRIVIKMDIEGAEIPVLEKMIADKTINMVDHLYVEWHGHKLNQAYKLRQDAVTTLLDDLGISRSDWN